MAPKQTEVESTSISDLFDVDGEIKVKSAELAQKIRQAVADEKGYDPSGRTTVSIIRSK